jgi:hypothetical protein
VNSNNSKYCEFFIYVAMAENGGKWQDMAGLIAFKFDETRPSNAPLTRRAVAYFYSGAHTRAGDRTEISHLQDRAEMPRERQSSPPPPTLIRSQDLQTAARPDFIDDIVRELTEGE